MKIKVITTVYNRHISLRRLIDNFILQSDSRWDMTVIHDGPSTADIKKVIALYGDSRVSFTYTKSINGLYGHPNRKIALDKLNGDAEDYVLITNDDNQYVDKFVEYFLRECSPGVGFVFCDTLHSGLEYNILKTKVLEHYIDMGSFIVRLDIAKKVGFNHIHFSADGAYAVDCSNYCRSVGLGHVYIPKALFTHN